VSYDNYNHKLKTKKMNFIRRFLPIIVCALLGVTSVYAQEKPLDFWGESPRLFTIAKDGQDLYHDLESRQHVDYKSAYFITDHADKQVGDFSIVFDAGKANNPKTFGFVSSLWGDFWELDDKFSLHLFIKVKGSTALGNVTVSLVDKSGRQAKKLIKAWEMNQWHKLSILLSDFEADRGFDYSNVKECSFNAVLPKDALVWFDGVHFTRDNMHIGVTDKSLRQRMDEERKTRERRITQAFEFSSQNDSSGGPWSSYFASLYLNKNVKETNAKILAGLDEHRHENPWSLFMTPYLCRLYYTFSSKAEKFPGRITSKVEKLLLSVLWDRTYEKNDIHWSKKSTWWMDGSENHDINAKACNLVSARIFMNEPEYKDRIYPDYGYGGGLHYGSPGYRGKKLKDRKEGGRASLSDGKEYNAADHYYAWRDFLKEYFIERAKKGFFLERSSGGYMAHTLNFVDLVYVCGGDPKLTQIVKQFKDLVWADWAQEQISGSRGGIKVRNHNKVGNGRMQGYMSYYLGGPGNGLVWWYWSLVNDYQLPGLVVNMALDRQSLGNYEYISRGVGEEENVWPRPLGTERTMLCDTESRFVKYSYVTPDYILSSQMEHPAAMHSHLSATGRWQGMVFAQSPECRIVTIGMEQSDKTMARNSKYDMEMMYRGAQSRSVMITQQSRRWYQINPDWYLAYRGRFEKPMGVYMGDNWDRMVEKSGWIFVESGNAYAAVRIILWDEAYEKEQIAKREGNQKHFNSHKDEPTVKIREDAYTWVRDHTVIQLEDQLSPVIIEGGQKEDYASLDAFMKDILDNDLKLYKMVVPGYNTLVYTGCGEDAREIVFNAGTLEIPTIGGEYIDYSYPMAFDSPYMKSEYKSGKIEIRCGEEILNLDFSK
jgi:hypothetical protein